MKISRHLSFAVCAAFVLSAAAGSVARAGELTPDLNDRLKGASPNELVSVIVHMNGGADAAAMSEAGASRSAIVATLKAQAVVAQTDLPAEPEALPPELCDDVPGGLPAPGAPLCQITGELSLEFSVLL